MSDPTTSRRRPRRCLACLLDLHEAHDLDLDPPASVGDLEVDEWALCELLQRRAWAAELGLDPEAVDLLALPPVPPATLPVAA